MFYFQIIRYEFKTLIRLNYRTLKVGNLLLTCLTMQVVNQQVRLSYETVDNLKWFCNARSRLSDVANIIAF